MGRAVDKRQRKVRVAHERERLEKWEDEVMMEERGVHEPGKEERGGYGAVTEGTKYREEKK